MPNGGPTRQGALTVVAQVKRDDEKTIGSTLAAADERVRRRLGDVDTLHFGRFVVFEDAFQDRTLLAFESNYDGDRAAHVRSLAAAIGDDLRAIFGHCEGFRGDDLERFVAEHAIEASCFYLGHPGLTVAQIRRDAATRAAIAKFLDEQDAEGALAGKSPRAIAAAALAHLATLDLAPARVDRGLPKAPWRWARLVGDAVGPLFKLALMALVAPVKEREDEREEEAHPPTLVEEDSDALDALFAREDHAPQNGITHVAQIKDGCYRFQVAGAALALIEALRKWQYFEGTLGGLSTIHFARWCVLPDGSLLFLSNYDGSWESYLGDFVDKAAWGLSLIWTNTRAFPKTRYFIEGGAHQELRFKRWARTFQVPNAIWYSAYPELSVDNVLDNAKLREVAAAGLDTDDAARAWLALV